jgi:gluconolactonase
MQQHHTAKSLLFSLTISAALLASGCSSNTAPAPETASKGDTAPAANSAGTVVRLDPALDGIIPASNQVEKLAGGFTFIEGPLWRPPNALWFSDVVGNVVRQWTTDGKVTEILKPGGYDGNSLPAGGYIGPNGMVADKDGAVLLCQHGNRRIARIAKDMKVTTVVDKYQGKKLNSPNDLVFHSDGSLYFTDPPYGLPKADDDPTKELPFNGVYRLSNGKLQVVVKDLNRPNGIAFSPDYKTLYVANSDEQHRFWMQYDVGANGALSNGKVFADVSKEKETGVPDGMKVDSKGNIYGTGPGGLWIFSPDGKHLGTIKLPEQPANCGWGDDGKSLYITAVTSLYRIKVAVEGEKALYQ